MNNFDYFEPESLQEACVLLDQHGDGANLIAGGTAIVIWMSQGALAPDALISLAQIPRFDQITFDGTDGLRIGAGARHRDIEMSGVVRQHYPMLYETFHEVAQPRIRNVGTVGGNLCMGDPLTDPGASLIALNADLKITSSNGSRTLPMDEFFVDYHQTALEPGEVLSEIHVPPPTPEQRLSRLKFTPRSKEEFATVGISLVLTMGQNGRCGSVRLAMNSVGPRIMRATMAEGVLTGERISETLLIEAGEVASEEIEPEDDIRGSADYKRDLVKVLVPRACRQAIASTGAQ